MAAELVYRRDEMLLPLDLIFIADNMVDALNNFIQDHEAEVPHAGYENEIRNHVFNFLNDRFHRPSIKNESRIYYDGRRHYRPDLFGVAVTPVNENPQGVLCFKQHKHYYPLQWLSEWGHDHITGIEGCINKPIADYIKWRFLFSPNGQYHFTPIPVCCFQVVTEQTGNIIESFNQIQETFNFFGTLVRTWKVEYPNNPLKFYVFMNYFESGLTFNNILPDPLNLFAQDIETHFVLYRTANSSWPMRESMINGTDALAALYDLFSH